MSKTYPPKANTADTDSANVNFPNADSSTKRGNPAYGAWPSDITSDLLTANTVRLSEPQLDNGHCYWLEQRPEEKGRSVVVCQAMKNGIKGQYYDVTPQSIHVRTKAHEYGGGSYLVSQNTLYFVNAADQRVYSMPVDQSSAPMPLSPEPSSESYYYYADFFIDHSRQQLICVCEIHRDSSTSTPISTPSAAAEELQPSTPPEAENNIVSLRLDGSSTIGFNVLVFGNDFYSNPSVSYDGEKLAWLTWNHPHMPWDNSECWIADFNHFGMLHKHRKVAGGLGGAAAGNTLDKGESIFQPQWTPTDDLLFVSDRNNWWNLYSYNTYNKYTEVLVDMPAEFATPQWVFGMSTYGFLNSYTLFCSYTSNGQWHLATIDLMSHSFTSVETPFTQIEGISCQDDDDTALFIGASPSSVADIIRWKKDGWDSIASSSKLAVAEDSISIPQAITFKNSAQAEVYGFFYPPKNPRVDTPTAGSEPVDLTSVDMGTTEKPPLIVMCHGGPTGASSSALNLKTQYWTSRGFAVFDINYSGSTGYGRDYRRRLYSQWGVVDVDDLCAGAHYLVEKGLVDAKKIAIRGSSAGGYSVLAALTFKDTFKAGASLYGIGDLSALVSDTHKFESRYCDQLIGEYPKEQALYQQRSPIHSIEQLNCPVIFLQGLEDKVVPPNQAEMMVEALNNKDIPVAHVTFKNEGHGFRQAENIRYAIDVEYAFYADIFGFTPAETLPAVPFIKPFIKQTTVQKNQSDHN